MKTLIPIDWIWFFFFFLIDNRTFIEKKEDCVHDDEHYGHEKNTESSRAKANS